MIPKISVRPAAIRKSITPNCSPFSAWVTRRTGSMVATRETGPSPLQRTLLGVGVRVILEHHAAILQLQLPRAVLDDLVQVEVLDGEVVVVVLERPAHRLEVRLAELPAQGVLVLDLAAHALDGGVQEQRGVVGLGRVVRR